MKKKIIILTTLILTFFMIINIKTTKAIIIDDGDLNGNIAFTSPEFFPVAPNIEYLDYMLGTNKKINNFYMIFNIRSIKNRFSKTAKLMYDNRNLPRFANNIQEEEELYFTFTNNTQVIFSYKYYVYDNFNPDSFGVVQRIRATITYQNDGNGFKTPNYTTIYDYSYQSSFLNGVQRNTDNVNDSESGYTYLNNIFCNSFLPQYYVDGVGDTGYLLTEYDIDYGTYDIDGMAFKYFLDYGTETGYKNYSKWPIVVCDYSLDERVQTDSYEQGYRDGYNAQNSLWDIFKTIFQSIASIGSIVILKIGGLDITLATLVGIPVVTAIILFILKFARG